MEEEKSIDELIELNPEDTEVIDSTARVVSELDNQLENYSVEDILERCQNEEQLSDKIPYENVRNNSKIFLIYFAKSQLQRVVKLSKKLEELEDRLIASSEFEVDPDTLMKIINTIQSSMLSAISLIDKVSTNDNYVKFVFNDNKTIVNNLNQLNIGSTGTTNLSKESRMKLRDIAENLLTKVDSVIDQEDNNE